MALTIIRSPTNLELPPGYRPIALRESGDAFAHACRIAAQEGAGGLAWVRRFDVAECAIILEPEEPLGIARKIVFAGMNAMADAIAAHCPPERAVTFDFPTSIRFDGGLVGGARLGVPKGASETAPPAWLVLGVQVRVAFPGAIEPGSAPRATALDDEGFDGLGPATLIESFARHFLRAVDLWGAGGFKAIASDYLARLAKERAGDRRMLEATGDLVTHTAGGTEQSGLVKGLAASAWRDAKTGMPKL